MCECVCRDRDRECVERKRDFVCECVCRDRDRECVERKRKGLCVEIESV